MLDLKSRKVRSPDRKTARSELAVYHLALTRYARTTRYGQAVIKKSRIFIQPNTTKKCATYFDHSLTGYSVYRVDLPISENIRHQPPGLWNKKSWVAEPVVTAVQQGG